jgi:microcystin-dependent protein
MAAQRAVSIKDMSGLKIIRLGTPTAAGDAATKGYVDSVAGVGGSSIPAGVIWEDAGTTPPAGWLACDGSVVNRADYPALFARISTNYNIGGEAATQFRLPNMKGRGGVGRDTSQSEFATLGQAGGAKTHTLGAGEVPNHTHGLGGHTYAWGANAGTVNILNATAAAGPASGNRLYTIQGDWSNTGGVNGHNGTTAPHNNLQPYIVLNYIIKT